MVFFLTLFLWWLCATPHDSDLKIPYFWAGSKAYDLVAGAAGLQSSYFLTREEALRIFPLLKEPGLSGAMVYYDGMSSQQLFAAPNRLLMFPTSVPMCNQASISMVTIPQSLSFN